MNCTNCGAKVDDSAKFCPVCGNKLDQNQQQVQQATNVVQTSTYESINTNEKLIEENKNQEKPKKNIFGGFISSIKSKKPGKKEDKVQKPEQVDTKIEVPQGMSEISHQDPVESLDTRLEYEQEISPSYYGYEPVDDRRSRDLRLRYTSNQASNNFNEIQNLDQRSNQNVESTSYQPAGPAITNQQAQPVINEQQLPNNESSLSAEQRIAQKLSAQYGKPNEPTTSNITYDDIPNEYLEARIARQLQRVNQVNQQTSYQPASNVNQNQGANPQVVAGAYRNYQNPANAYGYQSQNLSDQQNHSPNTYGQVGQAAAGVYGENLSSQAYGNGGYQNQPYQQQAYPPINQQLGQQPYVDPNQSEEVLETEEEKKGFSFKPIYLLPIVLLIAGLAIAYFLLNRKPDDVAIDLSNYIEVSFVGDDGSATPSASIDGQQLLADYGGQIAYINKDRKDDQYSSAANQFITELEENTDFNYSKEGNLSNGEEITVVADVKDSSLSDDYNVQFDNTIKSVIVDGLITQEVQDPFEYIQVDFEGDSPNISLYTSLTDDAPEYMNLIEIAPEKTTELQAGEEVNVNLIFNEEDIFNSYGIRLSPTDKIFVVPGEAEEETDEEANLEEEETQAPELAGGYISTVDNLDEDLLGDLKYKAGELIRDTFSQRSFTEITNIEYLGAITGSDANNTDLNNRVMLIYEIKANEDYEGLYTNDFTYYTFVEYQNVRDSKNEDGEYFSQGPLTTDNEIFHKFFVEDDYTYYEIPYYGFGFLEEVLARVNNALSGLNIDDSIAVDASAYFTTSDGVAGEYQGNGTRLSLMEDGKLRYKVDQRVHEGSWQEDGDSLTLTIQGVNVDTPINATFENGSINVSEQGEMQGQTFNKMQVTS